MLFRCFTSREGNKLRKFFTTKNGICKSYEDRILKYKPKSRDITKDFIGPPDKLSNLRPIVRAELPNETPLQKKLRLRQNEVEEWNFDFWTRHNKRFYDEKEEFVAAYKKFGIDEISADKMSVFYKSFLDKNRKLHFYYNMSWYLKNLDLLLLSAQNNIVKLITKLKS